MAKLAFLGLGMMGAHGGAGDRDYSAVIATITAAH